MSHVKTLRKLVVAALGAVALTPAALAQDAYPSRQVKIIVPYSPGAGADALARMLADRLKERLGQTVIVDNIVGAGSVIGSGAVARSPADGYTILLNGVITLFGPYLRPKEATYDPMNSLMPVVYIADTPLALVVRADFPAKTLREYIAYIQANPGKMTFGSTGVGVPQHVAMEQLKKQQKLDMRHVPYRTQATLQQDLAGGYVDAALFALGATGFADGKTARLLAACNEARCPGSPNVPSFKEEGIDCPGCGASPVGLFVPAGTPEPAIRRINAEANAIMKDPTFAEQVLKIGWMVRGGTPQDFKDLMVREKTSFSDAMSDPAFLQQ